MDQITNSFATTGNKDRRKAPDLDAFAGVRIKMLVALSISNALLLGYALWFWLPEYWYLLLVAATPPTLIISMVAIAMMRTRSTVRRGLEEEQSTPATNPDKYDDLEVDEPSLVADAEKSGGTKIPPNLVIAEICHRVGNSLQTTTSLIRRAERQMRKDADPTQETHACADILAVIGTRIATISFVQNMLYCEDQAMGKAGQVTQASLTEFLLSLVDHLKIIHERPNVMIRVEVTSTDVGSEHIQSAGLIVCELVTNALRHGYKVDDHGNVAITIRDEAHRRGFIMEVADDGCGMKGTPQKSDTDKGLSIVADLAAGLGSSVTFVASDKGVLCQIAPN
ncbi:sensor histidine kinase [uncultured Erythrobacter sp.]|uniref:sensor histidine kinase n=1 Tax=uncultured Erythrobacter sp. TaxID=263913 RepID=UPI00261BB9AC|nr:sensor histidine kinase [uncultured Erythrobacter sp.]